MRPLQGVRVIEMKGIGPGPYAGMLLADLGAEVIVIERLQGAGGIGLPPAADIHSRGKRSVQLDIKRPDGVAALLRLIDGADMLIEGFRPGVAERLGFGPDVCHARNPALVFGRVTGWGQHGPLAATAGHDINYIALTGALAAIGTADSPVPPLNLVGDYAGGSLFLVIGMLAALHEVRASGRGQVVDAAITDGAASLMSVFQSLQSLGLHRDGRASNMLDGGAHNYCTYRTADDRFIAVGALEPRFHAQLIEKAGVDAELFADYANPERWPLLRERLAQVFATRTRDEWCAVFDGSDACVSPVLSLDEAPAHAHHRARGTYVEIDGLIQPAPAPRFGDGRAATPGSRPAAGADTVAVLREAGFSDADIDALQAAKAAGPA